MTRVIANADTLPGSDFTWASTEVPASTPSVSLIQPKPPPSVSLIQPKPDPVSISHSTQTASGFKLSPIALTLFLIGVLGWVLVIVIAQIMHKRPTAARGGGGGDNPSENTPRHVPYGHDPATTVVAHAYAVDASAPVAEAVCSEPVAGFSVGRDCGGAVVTPVEEPTAIPAAAPQPAAGEAPKKHIRVMIGLLEDHLDFIHGFSEPVGGFSVGGDCGGAVVTPVEEPAAAPQPAAGEAPKKYIRDPNGNLTLSPEYKAWMKSNYGGQAL